MGAHVSRSDFEWVYTEEPHASRRTEILKKHPEIKKLMGIDHMLKWKVSALVVIQLITMCFMANQSWTTIFIVAYCFGGVINHSLSLSIHEIAHNVPFGNAKPFYNRLFGIWANIPLGVPMSVAFKKYHQDHHRFQSVDGYDPDLPTKLEAAMFCTTFTKLLWIFLQPVFYIIRPLWVRPKQPTRLELFNVAVQLIFDFGVWYFLGYRVLVYLIGGTMITMGFHPIAGHFIAEHYMFRKGYETYSYYGPLNCITFNVGYHMEHHDFPNIPGCNLPEVKRIASEYYDNLPQHTSWIRVLYDFITDPDIGPYTRIKRDLQACRNK